MADPIRCPRCTNARVLVAGDACFCCDCGEVGRVPSDPRAVVLFASQQLAGHLGGDPNGVHVQWSRAVPTEDQA